MAKKEKMQWERSDQNALVAWFEIQYPDDYLFCLPNQLVRNPYQARYMRRQGLISGLPDLFLGVASKPYHGLFIELKAPKTPLHPEGKIADAQIKIVEYLNARGYLAVICFGWLTAANLIREYRNGEVQDVGMVRREDSVPDRSSFAKFDDSDWVQY